MAVSVAGFQIIDEDLISKNLAREVLAEFIGTFFLIFIGCGAIHGATYDKVGSESLGSARILQIGLGFGLGIGCSVHLFSDVSGGQYNPAVSFGLFFARQLSLVRALIFSLAQTVGGLFGCGIIWAVLGNCPGAVGLGAGVSGVQGLFIEMFGTLFLVLTVLANVNERRGHTNGFQQPLSIGITIFTIHMFLVPTTGCGINPARSLVTALVNWDFPSTFYLYIVGPLMASIIGGLLYEFLFRIHYDPPHVAVKRDSEEGSTEEPSALSGGHPEMHRVVCCEKRTSFCM